MKASAQPVKTVISPASHYQTDFPANFRGNVALICHVDGQRGWQKYHKDHN